MAKSRNTTVSVIAMLLLLLLAAGIAIGIAAAVKSNGTLAVTINGDRYESNTDGLAFTKTTVVTVSTPADDYDVSIRSKAVSEDFEFLIGKETYAWSDTVNYDFTRGFNVVKNDSGFSVIYDDLISVIAQTLDYPASSISLPYELPREDLFVLIVISGGKSISLGFTLNIPITGIALDPSEIIF